MSTAVPMPGGWSGNLSRGRVQGATAREGDAGAVTVSRCARRDLTRRTCVRYNTGMSARDDKWTWVGEERVEVVPDRRLTALVEAIEDLRADDPGQRLPAELGDDLVQLRHACDLLELEFATRAPAFAAT